MIASLHLRTLILVFATALLTAQSSDVPRPASAVERPATPDDLRILDRADEVLSDSTKWDRSDDRVCRASDTTWSLFCAIKRATEEVLGTYRHEDRIGQAATREVRRIIEELNPGTKFQHRLMDYNNLPSTTFEDIKMVLKVARQRVLTELAGRASTSAAASAAMPKYGRTLQLDAGADPSASVSIGDVNGDARLDLVLIKGRHWPGKSRVLLGDGLGRFGTAFDLTDARYRSYTDALVDIDVDGALDVVLSNDRPDPKVILWNDGDGRFRRTSTFGAAAWPTRNLAVADLNHDGLPDLIVANRAEGASQYVCLNEGGRFAQPCVAFADYAATTITPGDVNGDGWDDLVVPHRDGGQSYVYLNDAKASVSFGRRIAFGPRNARMRMTAVGDLDGDSQLDIVAIDTGRNAVEIYYAIAGGGFTEAIPLGDGRAIPYALTVADLNKDRRPDVVVGYVKAPSAAFIADAKARRFERVTFGDNEGTVYGFAVADLDSDGCVDIAAARSDAPNMIYFHD